MEFLNILYGCTTICKCTIFTQDLLNLTKQILRSENELSQWSVFLQFQRQYLWRNRRLISHDGRLDSCPAHLGCMLLSRVEELKCDGLPLSTLLLDLIANIYWEDCDQNCSRFLERVYNTTPFGCNADTLLLAAFRGKTDFMKLLVNFGYLSSLTTESLELKKATERLLQNFIWSVSNTGDTYSMFQRIMDLIKSFFPSNEYGDFYKRMFFVGIALQVVRLNLKKDYNEAENLISCLRMYFTATGDLFLTIFEVRSVLYASFILLNKLHLFDKYCEEFDNLMPECPATFQPRKLSHLSRLKIRQNLITFNISLPKAIEKLCLPKILNSFVVGDKDELPSKTGYVSAKNAVTKSELSRLLFGRPSF